jgi:hypothetical protein
MWQKGRTFLAIVTPSYRKDKRIQECCYTVINVITTASTNLVAMAI